MSEAARRRERRTELDSGETTWVEMLTWLFVFSHLINETNDTDLYRVAGWIREMRCLRDTVTKFVAQRFSLNAVMDNDDD